jgi:hypothetical protein
MRDQVVIGPARAADPAPFNARRFDPVAPSAPTTLNAEAPHLVRPAQL